MSKAGMIPVLMLAAALAGCDSDSDAGSGGASVAPAQLRVLHTSPDAPAVDVLAGGAPIITNLDYGQASGQLEVNPGKVSLRVDARLPAGAKATVIGPLDVDLAGGTLYSVLAVGRVAGIAPLGSLPVVHARAHRQVERACGARRTRRTGCGRLPDGPGRRTRVQHTGRHDVLQAGHWTCRGAGRNLASARHRRRKS